LPATAAKLCAICGSATLLFAPLIAATYHLSFWMRPKPSRGPTSSPSAASAGAAENNGQDFTRAENLFQLRDPDGAWKRQRSGHDPYVTSESVTLRADFNVGFAPKWTFARSATIHLSIGP
jgi:hypothetical protein